MPTRRLRQRYHDHRAPLDIPPADVRRHAISDIFLRDIFTLMLAAP